MLVFEVEKLHFCVALFLQSRNLFIKPELQKHYDNSKIISDAPMFTSMLPDDEENENENENEYEYEVGNVIFLKNLKQ